MIVEREQKPSLGFYTLGIVALFLVGFFLLVIFGAKSYRDTVGGENTNMATRAELGYLFTTVRGNDAADAITVGGTADAPVLTVRDGESGYAFRIYLHNGALVEDYAKIDAPLIPEEAQRIAETTVFSAAIEKNVLRLTTDAGSVVITLRGEGGGK